eukprot:6212480-Pleurochrysis_carterae.AAC.5
MESWALQGELFENSKPFNEGRATSDPVLERALEHRFRSRVGLHFPDRRNTPDGDHHRPVEYYPVNESGVLVGPGCCRNDFDCA